MAKSRRYNKKSRKTMRKKNKNRNKKRRGGGDGSPTQDAIINKGVFDYNLDGIKYSN